MAHGFKRVDTGSHCCSKEGVAAMRRSKMKKSCGHSEAHKSKFGGGGAGGARPKRTKL